MNVYDCANELSRALAECGELQRLKETKAVLEKDADGKKMVEDFLKVNQEMELERLQGKEPDSLKQSKVQELYSILSLNSDAQSYLNALMRFQLLMSDINKAIGEPIKGVFGDL